MTPCGANSAPSTCPAPPDYRPNYLGTLDPCTLDLWTGAISPVPVSGADFVPQGGLLFLPFSRGG